MFNRNTMKPSYSCTGNLLNVIKNHNVTILETERSRREEKKICNFKNKINCSLGGEGYTDDIIIIAEVIDKNGFKKTYFRCTYGPIQKEIL